MSVQLTIVTPSRIAFEGPAVEVQIPGVFGEMGILPGHASLLTLGRPGVVTVHNGADTKRILVGKGIAEVGNEQVTLLVELCEDTSTIDKDAARSVLKKAQGDFKSATPGTPEHTSATDRIALSQARIDA
ncbi:MAG: F-type H+-transporting ATPase subunit epsilon [Myxococcota bacterium]|jgi:F-type H+-transporting ATPase subunit epsilon